MKYSSNCRTGWDSPGDTETPLDICRPALGSMILRRTLRSWWSRYLHCSYFPTGETGVQSHMANKGQIWAQIKVYFQCFFLLFHGNWWPKQGRLLNQQFLLWWNIHNINFTILTILSVQFYGFKCIHAVLQPSTTIHLQNVFIFPNWISFPLKHDSPFPSLLVVTLLFSASTILTTIKHDFPFPLSWWLPFCFCLHDSDYH